MAWVGLCPMAAAVIMLTTIATSRPEVVARAEWFAPADVPDGYSEWSHIGVMWRASYCSHQGFDRRGHCKIRNSVATNTCDNFPTWCCAQVSLPQSACMNATDHCQRLHTTIDSQACPAVLVSPFAHAAVNKIGTNQGLAHATIAEVCALLTQPDDMGAEICIIFVVSVTTANQSSMTPPLVYTTTSKIFAAPGQSPALTNEILAVLGQGPRSATNKTFTTRGQAPAANATLFNTVGPLKSCLIALAHALLHVTPLEQTPAAEATRSVLSSPAQDVASASSASDDTPSRGQVMATTRTAVSDAESPGQAPAASRASASGQTAKENSRLYISTKVAATGRPPTGTSTDLEVAMGWSESTDWSRLLDDVPSTLYGQQAPLVKTLQQDMLSTGIPSGVDTGVDKKQATWMHDLVNEMSSQMTPKVESPPPCTLSKRKPRHLLKSRECAVRAAAA